MHTKLTAFLLTFSILTALILPVSALLPTKTDIELYDRVIRLHVLANSDSESDQTLKLKVRDAVLVCTSELLCGVTDREAAQVLLSDNLDKLQICAHDVVRSEGFDYPVFVTLTKEAYPTRRYENVTLPSGTYTSLRVLIGESSGANWWCVLFPTLCIGARYEVGTAAFTEEMVEAGLTLSQIRLITSDSADVVIKFRLLEWIQSLRNR